MPGGGRRQRRSERSRPRTRGGIGGPARRHLQRVRGEGPPAAPAAPRSAESFRVASSLVPRLRLTRRRPQVSRKRVTRPGRCKHGSSRKLCVIGGSGLPASKEERELG